MNNDIRTRAEAMAAYKVRLAAAHLKLDRIAAELLDSARRRQLDQTRQKIINS